MFDKFKNILFVIDNKEQEDGTKLILELWRRNVIVWHKYLSHWTSNIWRKYNSFWWSHSYCNSWDIFVISCTTFEQITFTCNSAGTHGADVFIEDGFLVNRIIYSTFPCINDYVPNYVRGDHIISGPYNITIIPQSNSTITLFPGHKLLINFITWSKY